MIMGWVGRVEGGLIFCGGVLYLIVCDSGWIYLIVC